mmetsp:Transcript_29604/g.68226  ORF Transcript_29604/g.68226 Transcript_29604/m.68226 type:complete len:206 (+) Transcript_29604:184-801(+)
MFTTGLRNHQTNPVDRMSCQIHFPSASTPGSNCSMMSWPFSEHKAQHASSALGRSFSLWLSAVRSASRITKATVSRAEGVSSSKHGCNVCKRWTSNFLRDTSEVSAATFAPRSSCSSSESAWFVSCSTCCASLEYFCINRSSSFSTDKSIPFRGSCNSFTCTSASAMLCASTSCSSAGVPIGSTDFPDVMAASIWLCNHNFSTSG